MSSSQIATQNRVSASLVAFVGGEVMNALGSSWIASNGVLKSNTETLAQGYCENLVGFTRAQILRAIDHLKKSENRRKGVNPIFCPDPLELRECCEKIAKPTQERKLECSIRSIEMIATANLIAAGDVVLSGLADEVARICDEKIKIGFLITGVI